MKQIFTALVLTLLTNAAYAHSGHETSSFFSGLIHPFGADHLFAMLIVGIWSCLELPKKQIFLGPVLFVASLILGAVTSQMIVTGFAIGSIAGYLNMLEVFIGLSLVALSVMLFVYESRESTNSTLLIQTTAGREPLLYGLGLIALAGFLHGQAHGIEAPKQEFSSYVVGFSLTSAFLHGLGIALAIGVQRQLRSTQHAIARGVAIAFGLIGLAFTSAVVFA
jgi:urease accessory protein